MKSFNTAGTCRPNEHYMVDITQRLVTIRKMVAKGDYFCINRGRQYGKTTTLAAWADFLKDEYCVFSISFEGLDDAIFMSASTICAEFLKILRRYAKVNASTPAMQTLLKDAIPAGCREVSSTDFAEIIEELCTLSEKPVVLLIDEVDQASNNDGFVKFLGVLRNMYISRQTFPTFQSIILAGVYDIKNLKLKIRTDEGHQFNSPWNISVPFEEDMSLSAQGIAQMLAEYKAEHQMEFDEVQIGRMIREYTSGYPFLVSRICQIMDVCQYSWNKEGVLKAVNDILMERNTLFDNMIKKLDDYSELKQILKEILLAGRESSYNPDEKYIQVASMLNYIVNRNGKIAVACRIMETRLYNLFIKEEEHSDIYKQGQIDKSQFIKGGIIDMAHLMERFVVHMNQTYKMNHENEFIENDARKVFLTYLRPVINGIGSYHIEEQTRDHDRMDVVIDYLGRQYVVELKIWRGNAYNERGEEQFLRYLDYFNLKEGYLLSFCFNKTKTSGLLPPISLNGRVLIEAVV